MAKEKPKSRGMRVTAFAENQLTKEKPIYSKEFIKEFKKAHEEIPLAEKEKPLRKKAILLSSRKMQRDFHPGEYDDLLFYFDDVKEHVDKLKVNKKRFKEYTDLAYIHGWEDAWTFFKKRIDKIMGKFK